MTKENSKKKPEKIMKRDLKKLPFKNGMEAFIGT